MTPAVRIEETQGQTTAVVEYSTDLATMGQSVGAALGEVMAVLGESGVTPAGVPFSMYPDMQPDPGGNWRVATGFPVAAAVAEKGRVKPGVLPGGTVATCTHTGPYETLGETYRSMAEQIAQQGYEPAGVMWECYLTDPAQEPDPSRWRTDIYRSVRRRS